MAGLGVDLVLSCDTIKKNKRTKHILQSDQLDKKQPGQLTPACVARTAD